LLLLLGAASLSAQIEFPLSGNVTLPEHERSLLDSAIARYKKRLSAFYPLVDTINVPIHLRARLPSNRFPEWGIGFFSPRDNAIYLRLSAYQSRAEFHRVLGHEMAHAWSHALRRGQTRWPLWFEEGLAEYLAGSALGFDVGRQLSLAILAGQIIEQDSLNRLPAYTRQRQLFYWQSHFIVQLLVEQDLLYAFIEAKTWAGKPPGFRDWIDFEIFWQTELRERYGWYAILNFEVLIAILFVLLFLAVYIIKSVQKHKQLAAQAAAEAGEQEDPDVRTDAHIFNPGPRGSPGTPDQL
jgi:hypothetical protein